MFGDNIRDFKMPVDRQSQYPRVQAAMRVNEVRPTILANVSAEESQAASGPRHWVAVRQPRQPGEVVAAVDRHAIVFDAKILMPSMRYTAGSPITPSVNSGGEYRDTMTRRL
jgi:hypothetical protein